jgi:hypothetical protein
LTTKGSVADRHLDADGDLLDDDGLLSLRQLEPEPDPEDREQQRHDTAVDLERVLDHEEPILDELEPGDEDTAQQAKEKDRFLHDGIE